MQKVRPLSDRVRAALSEPTTSEALKALIESTGFEVETTRQRLHAAKTKAVDPLSTDAEAAEARREHYDLGFEEERQTSSIARLKHRLAEVLEAEEDDSRRVAYDAFTTDHTSLADRLRERYPVLAEELAGLLSEVKVMNERARNINGNRPSGAEFVQPVEHEARGPVDATYPYGNKDPAYERPQSLVTSIVLPVFESMKAKSQEPYLWHGRLQMDS